MKRHILLSLPLLLFAFFFTRTAAADNNDIFYPNPYTV